MAISDNAWIGEKYKTIMVTYYAVASFFAAMYCSAAASSLRSSRRFSASVITSCSFAARCCSRACRSAVYAGVMRRAFLRRCHHQDASRNEAPLQNKEWASEMRWESEWVRDTIRNTKAKQSAIQESNSKNFKQNRWWYRFLYNTLP